MAFPKRILYPAMGIYGVGTLGVYTYIRSNQPDESGPGRTWDEIADGYDRELRTDEFIMGLNLFRRWLVSQAKGDVLEVSAGTGRNLPYYRYAKLDSLTLSDSSKYMLWHANKKFQEKFASRAGSLPVSFFLSDAQQLVAPQPALPASNTEATTAFRSSTGQEDASASVEAQPSSVFATRNHGYREQSYDTVVDTFGLCSHADPVAVLQEMSRACKPDGQILLLEHGAGTSPWINKMLHNGAEQHLKHWGCQWDRDIEGIVKEAGLEIEYSSRWHFGTTYYIIARPAKAVALSHTEN